MKYDFDTVIDRRNTSSLKWNVKEEELPMWVADMDFQTAPEIRSAIEKRAAHGVFGYTDIPDAWYQAYIGWWQNRHNYTMEKEWLIFCTGIVPAISSMVRKLTTPAEKVLLQTPVYNIFFNSVLNNGRQVLESPLRYDGERYSMDFADLEEKLADPQTTLMILCNPQNPSGNIWDRQTLAAVGELCKKHHVTVISDEIHCDLVAPGCSYVPFASVSETCREISVTCVAPTKTFNIAGMQTAAVIVPDPVLRHKVWRGLNTDEVAEPNAFAVDAAIAAFIEGGPWLDALREYIWKNKETVKAYIAAHIPGVRVVDSDATYLMWLDCGAYYGAKCGAEAGNDDRSDEKHGTGNADRSDEKHGMGNADCSDEINGADNAERFDEKHDADCAADISHFDLAGFIREKTGLYLSSGRQYGGNGAQFLRLNVACPNSVVLDGMKRLEAALRLLRHA